TSSLFWLRNVKSGASDPTWGAIVSAISSSLCGLACGCSRSGAGVPVGPAMGSRRYGVADRTRHYPRNLPDAGATNRAPAQLSLAHSSMLQASQATDGSPLRVRILSFPAASVLLASRAATATSPHLSLY